MSKIVHLHIGLPKTATTLIQNSMFAAPETLERHDIQYVQSGTDKFGDRGHHILVQGTLGDRGRRILARSTDQDIADAWPLALEEIRSSEARHFFLSSELFSYAISDAKDITAIRDTLAEFDTRVILVLRDVADFVDSVYSQRLKGGFEGTVGEFVNRNWENLHWREMTQRWSRVFGRPNVTVLDFAKLKQGNLVDNFVQKSFGLTFEEEQLKADVANVALPYYAAQLLREVNDSDIPTKIRTKFRIQVRDFFAEHGAKGEFRKAKFLSEDSQAILRQYCLWPKMDD